MASCDIPKSAASLHQRYWAIIKLSKGDLNISTVTPQLSSDNRGVYQETHGWERLDKRMIHILGGLKQEAERVHQCYSK